jgi:hypothetical protein
MTFDLLGAQDVREAIDWAEAKLEAGEGPLSGEGVPVQDREYLIYAKVRETIAGSTSRARFRPDRLIRHTI